MLHCIINWQPMAVTSNKLYSTSNRVKRTPYAGKFVTYILPLNSIYMNLNPERYDSRTRKGKVTNLIWILKYVTVSFLDTLCGAGLSHVSKPKQPLVPCGSDHKKRLQVLLAINYNRMYACVSWDVVYSTFWTRAVFLLVKNELQHIIQGSFKHVYQALSTTFLFLIKLGLSNVSWM